MSNQSNKKGFLSNFLLFLLLLSLNACGSGKVKTPDVTINSTSPISAYIEYSHQLLISRNPVCEDFNKDGLVDVAILEKSPVLNIFINSQNGLLPPVKLNTNTHNTFLTAIDVDSDGYTDLLPVTESLIGPVYYNNQAIFTPNTLSEPAPTFGYFITSADLDNDGKPEAVATGFSSNEIKIMFSKGNNSFYFKTLTAPNTQSGSKNISLREAFIYDINSDGFNDILAADLMGKRILAAINQKNRDFTFTELNSFPSTVSSLTVIDNNGSPIVAATLESGRKVALMERSQNSKLNIYREIQTKGPPRRVVKGDMDGNGKDDIIVAANNMTSVGYNIIVVYDPGSKNSTVREIFLKDHDCTYLNVCDIYGKKNILCSDIERNKFFILNKDALNDPTLSP